MQCLYPASASTQVRPVDGHSTAALGGSQNTTFIPNSMIGNEIQTGEDFWDPNILASTNWLGTIDLDGFDLITPSLPTQAQSSQYHANGVLWSGSPLSVPASTPAVSLVTSTGESTVSYSAEGYGSQEHGGLHYLDGEPTRQPRTKRRRTQASTSKDHHSCNDFDLSQPDLAVQLNAIPISDHVYAQLKDAYHQHCLNPSSTWKTFVAAEVPSKGFFEGLLSLSRDRFNLSLPFIHLSSFITDDVSWATVAALVALGSHYMESERKHVFVVSMHEFVRRIVFNMTESSVQASSVEPIERCQIQLLHYIGTTYCGDARFLQQASMSKESLTCVFNVATRAYIQASNEPLALHPTSTDLEEWQTWRRKETTIRVANAAWLLDCMWAYQFQQRSSLRFCDGTIPLPCHERIWNAATAQEWKAARQSHEPNSPNNPSLVQAMAELYIDKSLPQGRGEFARVLMIHALFQRLWEVERSVTNPLSWWEPNVQRQQSTAVLPQEPIWLPSVPSYAAWQNTSCDALDILHWQANATIGQASGMEHPTVLHLHFARIVLLVPCEALVGLAQALSNTQLDWHKQTTVSNKDRPMNSSEAKMLSKWATAHQYKARLAAIHAGVVFWHVRRYSTDAFYEAPAVALAALTLWAFGVFAKQQVSDNGILQNETATTAVSTSSNHPQSSSGPNEDGMCEIILLDRPTDDELVQHFIKHGNRMQAHISGVGDLYNPNSPAMVLRQACKMLDELEQCWGVARSWNELLRSLSDTWSTQGKDNV